MYRGCEKSAGDGVQFHAFPNDTELQEKWVEASGNYYLQNVLPATRSRRRWICSDHFQNEDYDMSFSTLRKQLRVDAVPRLFVS